jgi:hypothetical protein
MPDALDPKTRTESESMLTSDPSDLHPTHQSRAVSFENPTGEKGGGGRAHGGRKGAPNHFFRSGETVSRSLISKGQGRCDISG